MVLEFCHNVWCEKTKMVGLSNGEKALLNIHSDMGHKRDTDTK